MSEETRLATLKQQWRTALAELARATGASEAGARSNLSKVLYTIVAALRQLSFQGNVQLALHEPLALRSGGLLAAGSVLVGRLRDPRVFREGDITHVAVEIHGEHLNVTVMLPSPDSFELEITSTPPPD